jgi:tetratricopeptide (TPR) repeat protein
MASACYDLLQAQSHVEAIECYRALRVPSAADRFHQATAHRALNDMPAAVREYSRALASAPGMPEAYINMGWVLSELDRTEEAAEAYASGLRLGRWPATTAATVHNNLGVLRRGLGDEKAAVSHFEAALAAQPDFAQAVENLRVSNGGSFAGLINGANELLMNGQNAEAAALYTAALPLRDPRIDGAAYVGLGAALHGARRLGEARAVLASGVKLNPHAPGMLQNLATVKTDLQEWREAGSDSTQLTLPRSTMM